MISLVVPVFKVKEEYIRRCIDCINNQTYKDFEVILVDDCTPDNGGLLCDELASNDSRIVVKHHERNMGLAGARETGMNMAKGEFLFFLDPDDIIEKDCLEKLFNAITEIKADIVLCKYRRNTDSVEYSNSETLIKIKDFTKIREDILLQNDTQYNIGSNWGKLYRLDFIRNHNIHFEESARKSQDRVFMFDYYGANPIAYMLDYVGYVYTVDNTDSICQKFNPNFLNLIENTSVALSKRIERESKHDFSNSLNGWYMMLVFDYLRLVTCNSQNPKSKQERISDFKNVLSISPYKDAVWKVSIFKIRKKCSIMILLLRLKQYRLCYSVMNTILK